LTNPSEKAPAMSIDQARPDVQQAIRTLEVAKAAGKKG
jgi:hypothetical protein